MLYRTDSANRRSCKLYSVSALLEECDIYLLTHMILAVVYHCTHTPWLLAVFLQYLNSFRLVSAAPMEDGYLSFVIVVRY